VLRALHLAALLAVVVVGCGGDEPRAEPARATPSPQATPTPVPEPAELVRTLAEGYIADLRESRFPGICQRFDPTDRPACYEEFRNYKPTAKQRREVADMRPGRIRIVQGGERAIVELDVGSRKDFARIYASRFNGEWGVITKQTYERYRA
jgi:hypothetical protein